MRAAEELLPTLFGPVQCVGLQGQRVHRVGYKPAPWNWTPWEYAKEGRFQGRWDDPAGIWRTLYVGSSALACYLEVLAPFRADPALATDMAEIIEDDPEEHLHPTVAAGTLARSWCEPRLICTATMTGWHAIPAHQESLPTLRQRFLHRAKAFGLDDIDAAAVRDSRPRMLTQEISAWIYTLTAADGQPVDGIQYESRHGDRLTLWALYERDVTQASPPQLSGHTALDITPHDTGLTEAIRIHRITWQR